MSDGVSNAKETLPEIDKDLESYISQLDNQNLDNQDGEGMKNQTEKKSRESTVSLKEKKSEIEQNNWEISLKNQNLSSTDKQSDEKLKINQIDKEDHRNREFTFALNKNKDNLNENISQNNEPNQSNEENKKQNQENSLLANGESENKLIQPPKEKSLEEKNSIQAINVQNQENLSLKIIDKHDQSHLIEKTTTKLLQVEETLNKHDIKNENLHRDIALINSYVNKDSFNSGLLENFEIKKNKPNENIDINEEFLQAKLNRININSKNPSVKQEETKEIALDIDLEDTKMKINNDSIQNIVDSTIENKFKSYKSKNGSVHMKSNTIFNIDHIAVKAVKSNQKITEKIDKSENDLNKMKIEGEDLLKNDKKVSKIEEKSQNVEIVNNESPSIPQSNLRVSNLPKEQQSKIKLQLSENNNNEIKKDKEENGLENSATFRLKKSKLGENNLKFSNNFKADEILEELKASYLKSSSILQTQNNKELLENEQKRTEEQKLHDPIKIENPFYSLKVKTYDEKNFNQFLKQESFSISLKNPIITFEGILDKDKTHFDSLKNSLKPDETLVVLNMLNDLNKDVKIPQNESVFLELVDVFKRKQLKDYFTNKFPKKKIVSKICKNERFNPYVSDLILIKIGSIFKNTLFRKCFADEEYFGQIDEVFKKQVVKKKQYFKDTSCLINVKLDWQNKTVTESSLGFDWISENQYPKHNYRVKFQEPQNSKLKFIYCTHLWEAKQLKDNAVYQKLKIQEGEIKFLLKITQKIFKIKSSQYFYKKCFKPFLTITNLDKIDNQQSKQLEKYFEWYFKKYFPVKTVANNEDKSNTSTKNLSAYNQEITLESFENDFLKFKENSISKEAEDVKSNSKNEPIQQQLKKENSKEIEQGKKVSSFLKQEIDYLRRKSEIKKSDFMKRFSKFCKTFFVAKNLVFIASNNNKNTLDSISFETIFIEVTYKNDQEKIIKSSIIQTLNKCGVLSFILYLSFEFSSSKIELKFVSTLTGKVISYNLFEINTNSSIVSFRNICSFFLKLEFQMFMLNVFCFMNFISSQKIWKSLISCWKSKR